MKSLFGKYLDVDLTTGSMGACPIPVDWQELLIGGKAIAARLLLARLPEEVDPLGPENILVFATGPFQGTGVVGAGRHAVLAVSPKTGAVADSYVGGYFGHELGRSGYDGILVRGASERPVVLSLIDGAASLIPAEDLWGLGTGNTETALLSRFPRARVSSIGIAGENLVSQACINSDRSRAAGRPGLGAVMGSKRLKAVVVRGSQSKPLDDPKRFAAERAAHVRNFSGDAPRRFGEYGTARLVTLLSEMGILPTRNFREGVFDRASDIDGVMMHDTILVGRETCSGCPIRCKRQVRTSFDGRAVDPSFGGPEYETAAALGSLCLNGDLNAIALGNQLCNDYGLDTISTGTTIAFLMEASEKGLIDDEISWGDPAAVVRLIDAIAHREGIGDRVADGLAPFAREIGADFAMTIKGVELPLHEPRGKQGLGLSYATSPRGATHLEVVHDTMFESEGSAPEIGIERAYDRFTLSDKPIPTVAFESLISFTNSLILCVFTSRILGTGYRYPQIRSMLEAATGRAIDADEMSKIGRRAYALMRILSGRAGHRMEDDGLPARFAEALPRGASAGHSIDSAEMREAIAATYALRGYDAAGPTDETLEDLGIGDCAGRVPRTGAGTTPHWRST